MIDRSLIKPNCYAVIFSLERSNNLEGYAEMDEKTIELVKNFEGYLGYESVYNGNRGIFISYWENMDAINTWKADTTHLQAKAMGKLWYAFYHSLVCKVEHASLFLPEENDK